MASRPTILVVDDERDLADLYATWVRDEYDVLTAYDGSSALEQASEEVDVVLLDRHMPDLTGDEVLRHLRNRGLDCWVIMVTAVDPGLDIVELDIDDYVTKPVSRSTLVRIIENLRVQSRYVQNGRRELSAISNKLETLEEDSPLDGIEETEEYQRLEEDLKELSDSLVEGIESDEE